MGRAARRRATKVKQKLENYVVCHFAPNGRILVFRVEASCLAEAQAKIDFFFGVMDICRSDASDEEILSFIERNDPSCLRGAES